MDPVTLAIMAGLFGGGSSLISGLMGRDAARDTNRLNRNRQQELEQAGGVAASARQERLARHGANTAGLTGQSGMQLTTSDPDRYTAGDREARDRYAKSQGVLGAAPFAQSQQPVPSMVGTIFNSLFDTGGSALEGYQAGIGNQQMEEMKAAILRMLGPDISRA